MVADPRIISFDSKSFSVAIIPMFDDGSAAAKALTLASPNYYSSDGDVWHDGQTAKAPRQEFNRVKLLYTISGTAPTELLMKVLSSIDGGATAFPDDLITSISSTVVVGDLEFSLPVTVGEHSVRFPIDPGIQYSIQFARVGGDDTTAIIATGVFVRV
jgi:hypothetical protein